MENNENKKEENLKKVKNIIDKTQWFLNKKNLFILWIVIILLIIAFTVISAVKTTPEKVLDKVYKNTIDTLKIVWEKANGEIQISCDIEKNLNQNKKDCKDEIEQLNKEMLEKWKNFKEEYEWIKKELKNCESFLKWFKAVEKCKWQVLQKSLYKISIKSL